MKKDKTYMNSFIFNVSLILLGSCAITQFCADCLYDYVSFTDIDSIFNVLIKNLKIFNIFYKYHIFQYIFFGIFILSLIFLLCRPTDRRKPIYSSDIQDPKEMKLLNVYLYFLYEGNEINEELSLIQQINDITFGIKNLIFDEENEKGEKIKNNFYDKKKLLI